jgi:hypothetical protein
MLELEPISLVLVEFGNKLVLIAVVPKLLRVVLAPVGAEANVHVVPLYINVCVVLLVNVTPLIVKVLVSTLLTYAIRPAVGTVGVGSVRLNPIEEVVMLKVVATSTVALAAPIGPLPTGNKFSAV